LLTGLFTTKLCWTAATKKHQMRLYCLFTIQLCWTPG